VFTVAFNVPAEAEEITVWVDLGSSGHNYARVQRVIDTTPGTLTTVTGWTVATRSISISGSVDTNDGPYANESLELVVQAYNGAIQIDGDYSSFVLTNGAGNYSAEIFLPAGTTRVVLDPQLPEQPPVTLQPIAGAVTTFTNVDFFTPGGVEVDVTMQMKINGSAMPASMFDLEVIGYTADDDGDGPFDVFAVSGEGTEVDYTPLGGGVFSASAFVSADAQFVTVQMTMAISGPPIVYKRTFAMQDLAPSYAVNLSLDHNTANRLHITGTSQVRNPDESGDTSCAIEGEDVKFPFRVEVVALDAAPDDDPFETSVLDTIVLPSGSQFVPINDSWDLITRVPSNTQWVELRFSTPYHEPQYVDANYAMADIYGGGIDLWQVLVDATCEGN